MTEDPRISEIRAEVASWHEEGPPVPREVLNRVRAILDRPAPAPRVWFPGDTVPADIWTVNHFGDVLRLGFDAQAPELRVEVPVPSPEEFQAAIDRARAEREETSRG